MAKPYLIYKKPNGFFYAEILLPDGSHANRKSTGCKNRADAEKAMAVFCTDCENDTAREIKIPKTLRDMLLMQARMKPHNEGLKDFVFYGLNPGHLS